MTSKQRNRQRNPFAGIDEVYLPEVAIRNLRKRTAQQSPKALKRSPSPSVVSSGCRKTPEVSRSREKLAKDSLELTLRADSLYSIVKREVEKNTLSPQVGTAHIQKQLERQSTFNAGGQYQLSVRQRKKSIPEACIKVHRKASQSQAGKNMESLIPFESPTSTSNSDSPLHLPRRQFLRFLDDLSNGLRGQ